MASSSSNSSDSDGSNKAPGNFQISSNDDDDDVCDGGLVKRGGGDNNVKNVRFTQDTINRYKEAAEGRTGGGGGGSGGCCGNANSKTLKCPLCQKQQTQYVCRNCVKNGNIVHSKHKRLPEESLLEKQQRYLSLQRHFKEFAKRCEDLLQKQKSSEVKVYEIKCERDKIKLLEDLVARKRNDLHNLSVKRDQMHKANADKRKHLPNYPIKVKELSDYVLDRFEKIEKLRDDHRIVLDKLKILTRRSIKQLVEYVFPISEVVLRDEARQRMVSAAAAVAASNKLTQQLTVPMSAGGGGLPQPLYNNESETIAALADAKNTSYIRGKWVFHGSGISEMQYRIVAPSLPANGDYSAYIDWLAENKDDIPKATANEITPSRVVDCDAFRIIGALTYTTQLVQLLSSLLNVRLPYKLAYGDFCKKLNEKQFLRKVSRLNSNVMYLAYTQQVKLSALNENHTLENVLAILDLDRSDLGRYGYHEVTNAPLMKSIDSLLIGIETATESESEDEISLRLDWEAVSNLPTQQEIMNSNLMTNPMGQHSTIADSFMVSAAKGISSIFGWRNVKK